MNDVAKRLANFGAQQKAATEEKREQQATEMRSRLAEAGILDFAEAMKAEFGAKLAFFRHGDFQVGSEPDRGCTDCVLLDLENKRLEASKNASARQVSKRR